MSQPKPDSKAHRPGPTPWDSALRYLGVRAHSQYEIEQKLSRRGFTAEEVQTTVERLQGAGLIDDGAFAREFAESFLRSRLASQRELTRQLSKRGISEELIAGALGAVSQEDEFSRALQLAEKKMRPLAGAEKDVRWRRTLAFLSRRGFPQDICFSAVREVESALELDRGSTNEGAVYE